MWSAPVIIVEPASEPVSLDEAKEFVSIEADETEFDTLIAGLIVAARQQVEAVTGTRLVEQTVRLEASEIGDLARLPIGPVTSVSGIVFDDLSGAEQSFAGTDWEVYGTGLERGIRTKVGKGWPNSVRNAVGAIRVTAVVGYETLPRPLWTAMLLMVGDLFANRETVATGSMSQIPMSMTVEAQLANYRIWL